MPINLRSDYQDVLSYIENYWKEITYLPRESSAASMRNWLLLLGNIHTKYRFATPNNGYFKRTRFYWDSYFTILGLVVSGRVRLSEEMIDNHIAILKRFHIILARNNYTSLGRTQPPLLTSMISEVYHRTNDRVWYEDAMSFALREYEEVWMQGRRFVPELGLSRYNPRLFSRWFVNFESGWDLSTRFSGEHANSIPIDLNCMLFQYEEHFLNFAHSRGDEEAGRYWQQKLEERRERVNRHLWNHKRGFFFDYSLESKSQSPLLTLAGFFPMWCGLATAEQAEQMLSYLPTFERSGGLASTEPIAWRGRQWDYPNGWANLHYIVISGLLRYGYGAHALRIARKWLDLNAEIYRKTGYMWEKYDVVRGDIGRPGRYPTPTGFAWTNAVFIRLIYELETLEGFSSSS